MLTEKGDRFGSPVFKYSLLFVPILFFLTLSLISYQSSPGAAGKLEKWLSSPPTKAVSNSSKCSEGVDCTKLDRKNIVCTFENSGSRNSMNGSQSPFVTPPSLSYCQEKVLVSVDSLLTQISR